MEIDVPSGIYVLAVSGGVDSMVLMDTLAGHPDIGLVVAHFDHGIRAGGAGDAKLVAHAAERHGLKVEIGQGYLGRDASEAAAREARYEFLERIQKKYRADKIITAHHQDDLIETAFINIIRGTGSKGLASMKDNPNVLRPLIDTPKSEITAYARVKGLKWHEDPSNKDTDYLRNYIRHNLLKKLTPKARGELLASINNIAHSSAEKDKLIAALSRSVLNNGKIDRFMYISLPVDVGNELMAFWLRNLPLSQIDSKTIERLSLAIKTAPAGTKHNVRGKKVLIVSSRKAYFDTPVE